MTSELGEKDAIAFIQGLSADDVDLREEAAAELQLGALRHRERLRKAHEGSSNSESKARLASILQRLEAWEDEEAEIRANPEVLQGFLRSLPKEQDDLKARADRLYRTLRGR